MEQIILNIESDQLDQVTAVVRYVLNELETARGGGATTPKPDPVQEELKRLQEEAPMSHTFDPSWFLIAEDATNYPKDVRRLNQLAVEVAERYKDPRGVARLITYYSGGEPGITKIPPSKRMCLFNALLYLNANTTNIYELYAEGVDTTK